MALQTPTSRSTGKVFFALSLLKYVKALYFFCCPTLMFWACADVSSCIQGSKACRILHIFFLLSTGNTNTSFTFSCTFVGYVGKGKCADGLLIWHYSFNTLDSIHGSNKMLIPGWYVLHWVFKASIVNERLLVWYSKMDPCYEDTASLSRLVSSHHYQIATGLWKSVK